MENNKIDIYRFKKLKNSGVKAWYFSFYGRVGRLAFLGRLLIIVLVLAGVVVLNLFALSSFIFLGPGALIVMVLMTLFTVFLVMASSLAALSLYVRRLHDINLSGYWVILVIVLWFIKYIGVFVYSDLFMVFFHGLSLGLYILNLLILLVLLFWPGSKGLNKYGMNGRQSIADAFE